ncbi:hypothetical protein BCR43DRAFT_501580 [Syncephalastrum racemosum]|uniref:Uncharacterized protein n=1 Tax=Syncephalastrum racemosum TaxID=13706 RepID=A0A1X2HVZ2_SYNRA|nr:hypothetical protein BCR43DRAFT_501580 [Syncephalastrum racemosum]
MNGDLYAADHNKAKKCFATAVAALMSACWCRTASGQISHRGPCQFRWRMRKSDDHYDWWGTHAFLLCFILLLPQLSLPVCIRYSIYLGLCVATDPDGLYDDDEFCSASFFEIGKDLFPRSHSHKDWQGRYVRHMQIKGNYAK